MYKTFALPLALILIFSMVSDVAFARPPFQSGGEPETQPPKKLSSTAGIGFPAMSWWKPKLKTSWQIQYSGTMTYTLNVQVNNIDLFETSRTTITSLHAKGRKVMCYFSAGSWEDWRPDANKFPAKVKGKNLEGWPGEKWLDIRQGTILYPIMAARLNLAKQKGCDGVDPDNVNGFENDTGFPLTGSNQLVYNRWLANEAHKRGLAIGLKNDLNQIKSLVSYFDWALNEQCFEYDECDLLLPFIKAGKPVFVIEYKLTNRTQICTESNQMNMNTIFKKLALDSWRVSCR